MMESIHQEYIAIVNTCTPLGVPIMAQWLMNLTRNHEVAGLALALPSGLKDLALP